MRSFKFALGALFVFAVGLSSTSAAPAQPAAPVVRIALMSDAHATRGTNEEQLLHAARVSDVVTDINAAGVDLVLVAGDLTENGWPDEIEDFKRQIAHLRVPAWYVPGNHDVGNKRVPPKPGTPEKSLVNSFRVARYEMRLGPSWFAREHAGVRIIGVNSALMASGLARERSMWRFLEEQLAKPSKLPTLVFMHHPPFVDKPEEPGGDYFNLDPYPRHRLIALLRQGGVSTVLSGHLHREIVHRYQGILFVTSPASAFSLPRKQQRRGWTLVTVAGDGKVQTEFRYMPRLSAK